LDQADALRQKRKQAIAKLDTLLQSIFLNMFGDPITNPKGWEFESLYNCCNVMGGGTPTKSIAEYYDNGTIPWVSPKDMKQISISTSKIKITELGVKNSSVKLIPASSVLMVVRSGILKSKLPLGITENEVTVNQDMKAFVPMNYLKSQYLLYHLMAAASKLLTKVRAFTADNISTDDLKKVKIMLPPLELQIKFEQIVNKHLSIVRSTKNELSYLDTLFNSLQQRAFKGEL
jgi:type I restriction enzyme S subunit